MRFKDTHLLRPAAEYFSKNGVYTKHIPDTKGYYDFWDQEKTRCLEGYEADGVKITGYHYFYLNYFKIARAVKKKIRNREVEVREYDFPSFWDYDYDFFWTAEIARHGISKKEYEDLNLSIDIHEEDLEGGKQMVIVKSRRKGYSYKAGSMLCRNYYFMPRSKNYVMAYSKKYLEGDGVYQKFLDGIAFVDGNTPFIQPRIISRPTSMIMKSGYTIVEQGTEVEKGTQSMVQGISLKDNPDGARGIAGELIFFEEAGKFSGLKKAWDITLHTVKEGLHSLGLLMAYGTGGTSDADFSGVEALFSEPENNDCIRINNQWDDGADGTYCGFFVPIYQNLAGFMDKEGNSLVEEAIAFEEKGRKMKKQSKTSDTYSQHVAELPFKPSEALLSVDLNIFPTNEILAQKNSVKVHNRHRDGVPGKLYQGSDGTIKFKYDLDLKPVYKFPHNKDDDLTGCHVVYEAPVKINGNVPKDLYILCHDPYAHDKSTGKVSLGASYVLKRTNDFSPTFNECIVASYVARPESQDEYNKNMFLLSEYYNAKIGFENDRGDVKGYATRFKKLHMLEEQFAFLDKKALQGTSRRSYGMNMTAPRKEQGEIYLRDWLLTPIQVLEDGEKKLILHTITDPALLDEFLKFHRDGNFDRCLLQDTLITTNDGYKEAKDIKEGDLVLTHTGTYKPVTVTSNHKSDSDVYKELSFIGEYEKLKVTPNHPIYTLKYKTVGQSKIKKERQLRKNFPDFIEAGDVTKEHMVLRPKRKGLKKIKYEDDLLYLMGWYLADGYLSKQKNRITFSLQGNQELIADRLVEIIDKYSSEEVTNVSGSKRRQGDLSAMRRRRTKTAVKTKIKNNYMFKVSVTSKFLTDTLSTHCGTANNKKISEYLYNSKGLLPLVIGFLEGDGHQKTNANYDGHRREIIECSSVYEDIIKKIRQILIDEGIWSSVSVIKKRNEGYKDQYRLNISRKYINKISDKSHKFFVVPEKNITECNSVLETDEGFWLRVKDIETKPLDQNVINFEVEEDHTYIASNVVTHNCMALMIGMYHRKELYNKQVKEIQDNKHEEFFNRFVNDNQYTKPSNIAV